MKSHSILVVGNPEEVGEVSHLLREWGYCTLVASELKEALEVLKENVVDLLLLHQVPRNSKLDELLEQGGEACLPRARIILSQGQEEYNGIGKESEESLTWLLTLPCEVNVLCTTVRNALRYGDLLSKSEALLQTAHILAAGDISFEDKLQRVLSISLNQIGAEKGSIMLRDAQGNMVVRAATNRELIGAQRSLGDTRCVSVWVARHGVSLFVENISGDPRFMTCEDTLYKSNSVLCVPIRNSKDEIIGVFNVTDKKEGLPFVEDDEVTLTEFINRTVLLIENARLKEDLEEERAKLEKTNKELLALERMREDLVNMIIHDLKGPLGEVMANLDLLSYSDLENPDREYLDTAIQGSNNLLRMIFNLLDVKRMEEGKLKVCGEEFGVRELIQEVATAHKTLLKQKGIEVRIILNETVSTWVADRQLLARVLSNLLMNAIECSPRGSVIDIVGSRYLSHFLRMEVKDRGRGIPREFQQQIFDKFSQVEDDGNRRRRGAGLGLAFCKMAIEAHQGKLWVESEEGRGSSFIFLLPQLGLNVVM